jgi:hypothetical protein
MAAFSSMDLILGTFISVVLVGSLGGVALISELRFARDSEVNQSLRDTWGRTLAFITDEAEHAYWIRTSITTPPGYPCGATAPSQPLVLDGPPNPADPSVPIWRVVYGVKANSANDPDWRGVNRLVRCGPPFEEIARNNTPQEKRTAELLTAASSGNLSITKENVESVIADQLPAIATIRCPASTTPIPGTCTQPFQARLFDSGSNRDRDAQVNLFLSRSGNASTYPPPTLPGFHTQIRANRNPGFDVNGNPKCITTTDASTGNQEPPAVTVVARNTDCEYYSTDSTFRRTTIKEYNLTEDGEFRINASCVDCDSPRATDITDVVFLKGTYDSFSTKQFSLSDSTRPCSRKSCYLSNGKQKVQIYDGNMVVFLDRILRL